MTDSSRNQEPASGPTGRSLTLFLCGDLMLGRGVDQVLPRSCDPRLHERWVRSARRYVELAEDANGPIPAPVDFSYPWGDALPVLEAEDPDARIVNLETAVTTGDDRWRGKGIHYRTHPENVGVLEAGGVDCCVLANNHAMDWGRSGLQETLEVLRGGGIAFTGAGVDRLEAAAPAVLSDCEIRERGETGGRQETGGAGTEDRRGGCRVVVHAFGSTTSGIPREWAAAGGRPGVNLLEDLSEDTAREVAAGIRKGRQEGELVVASIHWGGNWGYRIPPPQRRFAQLLVEEGGADVVHGHSSHHPKGIEVHRGRPILYGCGDFLNDYEGISGHESYRGDLALMYFVTMSMRSGPAEAGADGEEVAPGAPGGGETCKARLHSLEMVPMRIRRFRLQHASPEEARWLTDTLDRECRELGGGVELAGSGRLLLQWAQDA